MTTNSSQTSSSGETSRHGLTRHGGWLAPVAFACLLYLMYTSFFLGYVGNILIWSNTICGFIGDCTPKPSLVMTHPVNRGTVCERENINVVGRGQRIPSVIIIAPGDQQIYLQPLPLQAGQQSYEGLLWRTLSWLFGGENVGTRWIFNAHFGRDILGTAGRPLDEGKSFQIVGCFELKIEHDDFVDQKKEPGRLKAIPARGASGVELGIVRRGNC